jgi:hypothetical protein
MLRARRLILTCCLLLLTQSALAQSTPGERALKLIDFEERQLGNNEDLPMHWVKISGPGLPHYVNGKLADDRAHSGQYSFRIDLNGGSAIYRYDPTQIPVTTGGRYRVRVYCLTTVLPNARARLTAYFTDQDSNPLPASLQHSETFAAKSEFDGWHALNVELSADDPKAAYLAVELELLQPILYAPNSLGDRTILPQDIHGSAWFDDVSISQVPKVVISTANPGNIFRQGDPLQLQVDVHDLFTGDLSERMVVTNGDGTPVYQFSGTVPPDPGTQDNQEHAKLTLGLPQLSAGWYRASLVITSHGQDLGQQSIDMIVLADSGELEPPDPRFGVIATDVPLEALNQLPSILTLLSAGRVKLAIWNEQNDMQQDQSVAFDSLVEDLQTQGITPTGCLIGLPPAVAQTIGGSSWLNLLTADPNAWQPQIAYLLARHANHLDQWQLGADGSETFASDPRMRQVYKMIYDQFSDLIHNPDLAMPWPAWSDLGGELPATLALSVPPEVLPERIGLYAHDILDRPEAAGHNLSLTLQLLDEKYDRQVRLRDLALRMIFALAAGANRVDLPLPLNVQTDDQRTVAEPREEFLVERTLMRTLDSGVFKGRIPVADGVNAMLFDRDGQGVMALWTTGNQPQQIQLEFGSGAIKEDLWGNAIPLVRLGNSVRLEVGPLPCFLVGIDSTVAQLLASVGFDRPFMESSFQDHQRQFQFQNFSQDTISGLLRIQAPTGWTISPVTFPFALQPGQKFDRPVTIEFPYNSVAGARTFQAQFVMDGANPLKFTAPVSMTLGLTDVGLQTLAWRHGHDLLVQELITNFGDQPINYDASASYPGQSRQDRLIAGLAPGASTAKLFRFKDVHFLPGVKARVELRESEGLRVLNDEVAVP